MVGGGIASPQAWKSCWEAPEPKWESSVSLEGPWDGC